jgi:hypothetical protein
MDPIRYLHLRYLQRVRRALLRKDEAEVTKRYGFGDRDQSAAA